MSDDRPGETFAYRLRQHMNGAVRELRDAEDFARMEMPGWPTADRIRDIYEQITDDILNGKTTIPPLKQRLATAEADLAAAQAAAREMAKALARIRTRRENDGCAADDPTLEWTVADVALSRFPEFAPDKDGGEE